MKKLVLVLALALGTTINAQKTGFEDFSESDGFDISKGFDVQLFQKYLTQEMYIAFPWMIEDTTNNYAAKAINQKEAGSPMCYATKGSGMVNHENDELEEAKRVVKNYQNYIYTNPYAGGEKTIRKYYVDFSAVATKQYGGVIRYGIILDNNITEESLTNSGRSAEKAMKKIIEVASE
jgi:hypothetical protein